MTKYVPIVTCIVGLIVFFNTKHPDIKEAAKDLFWCGLLVTLFQVAGGAFRL